jgi:hypothetical protein
MQSNAGRKVLEPLIASAAAVVYAVAAATAAAAAPAQAAALAAVMQVQSWIISSLLRLDSRGYWRLDSREALLFEALVVTMMTSNSLSLLSVRPKPRATV